MNHSRIVLISAASAVCLVMSSAHAGAQDRGRQRGRRGDAVVRSTAGAQDRARPRGPRGDVVGRAVPRPSIRSGRPIVVAPRNLSPRRYGAFGYRPYYYPYRSGLGFGVYSSFGYPYRYGSPYRYGYPYGYGYGYGTYGYPVAPGGYYGPHPFAAYGGVRIKDAPQHAQVFVDGYYVGVVDDFDGIFQQLDLEAGPHRLEIRAPGYPPAEYDVNVQPGLTMTVHAGIR